MRLAGRNLEIGCLSDDDQGIALTYGGVDGVRPVHAGSDPPRWGNPDTPCDRVVIAERHRSAKKQET